MTLSQSSSDMWSRNSSRVMPAQDTTTDGGREKQAYGREGGANSRDHKGPGRGAVRRGAWWFTCTCSSRRLAAGGPRHVRLEGSVLPARRPVLAARAAQQPHGVLCGCPVQVAGGHGGALFRQAHADRTADAAART